VKKTKITADRASAFFWIVVGILACYGATGLGLGSIAEPGAGFIFFWSGLILVILSFMVWVQPLRSTEDTVQETAEIHWPKIALVLLSLLLYGFLLERLGFVISTFLLMSFLLGWIEDTNWARSFAVAGAAALASYGIFELWLKIRLPKGIFGF
jgi:putative tricarboxylic transport membrane protein